MRLFLFCLLVAVATWTLAEVTSQFIATLLLSVLSIVASLESEKIRDLIKIGASSEPQIQQKLQQNRKFHQEPKQLIILELVFILLALVFIMSFYAEAITLALEDLVQKGFLSFDKKQDGFIHIQTYIFGYVFLLPAAITLGLYGFILGAKRHSAKFLALLLSISLGLLLGIVLVSLMRGEWTGTANYQMFQRVNPDLIPMGARFIPEVFTAGAALLVVLILTAYVYLSQGLGRGWSSITAWLAKRLRA